MIMRTLLKIILPIVIIVLGVLGAGYMLSNPQRAARAQQPEQAALVEVISVPSTDEAVIISAQGTVIPSAQVALRPEVAGRIIAVDEKLVAGGIVRRGEQLARIDPRDYAFAVEAQKERVADALYRLKLEQGQAAVAAQEWELIGDSVPSTDEGRELALRKPQIEKAEASLAAAHSALEKANLDLARTQISAPFNAVILRESVDIGQVISTQGEIALLAGTDEFWIQVLVPVENLAWIEIPGVNASRGSMARVIQQSGRETTVRDGRVVRLLSDLDEAGRLARLIVAIQDPLLLRGGARQGELPLLLGSYVNVEISGRPMRGVYVLPRSALRDGEESAAGAMMDSAWVWVSGVDDRLEFREVTIGWMTRDQVYVTGGLDADDRVITSGLATPIKGLKLRYEAPVSTVKPGM
jgi:RND family efflux transporter MFP subunit